ncbi:MAG TPA: hydroxymethylbilane synthase [Methanocorpusculum sp.]|nr:hydroxymethylbilane synthase [Methanocorpusculum sp.]
MSVIRIGTRGSKLARIQTTMVCDALKKQGFETEQVVISTKGDRKTDVPLNEAGGNGLFVREIDIAILEGRIDAAVHSMKDIPLERPAGITTAAVLKRAPPFDFLVVNKPMMDVMRFGTSSPRRRAQLLRYYHKYPEMHIAPIRGNIDTRLEKLESGEYDALVLAEAGLMRLGLHVNGFRLPADAFVPSPNQGAIAVVSRDTPELKAAFATINDPETAYATAVERIVMEELGADCFTPVGIYSQGGRILAEVLSPDGTKSQRVESEVPSLEAAHAIGHELRKRSADLLAACKAVFGDD